MWLASWRNQATLSVLYEGRLEFDGEIHGPGFMKARCTMSGCREAQGWLMWRLFFEICGGTWFNEGRCTKGGGPEVQDG